VKAHGAERGRASARGNGSASGRVGPQGREGRARAGEGNRRRQLGPTGQRERERRVRGRLAPTGGVRLSGAPGTSARAAGPGGLVWAKLDFSFFLNFLIAFPFLFSRVFNSNSNQISNLN
jgi:hypothetical protein